MHSLGIDAADHGRPSDAWSLFANLLNYGIVGGFFVGEYLYRKRRFPGRYTQLLSISLRRMAALGPAFWRGLLRYEPARSGHGQWTAAAAGAA